MPVSDSANVTRLYKQTYLQLIKNSLDGGMFRNFYVQDEIGVVYDALDDGENSCAFYVSSVLNIMAKLKGVHGTVAGTEKDLQDFGWQTKRVDADVMPGDVIVWGPANSQEKRHAHIGFSLGDNVAVSTSSTQKVVAKHDLSLGDENRQILAIYRYDNWD